MSNTMKVKPWGKGQGDHVVIDADKFDPDKHQKIDGRGRQKQQKDTEKG